MQVFLVNFQIMPACVLTIAASDPSGGAGVEMDLKVFQAHHVFGLTAITALTVQSSRGLLEAHPTALDIFVKILDELALDLQIDAVKIGVVATTKTTEAIADFLEGMSGVPVVLDPVMAASSGGDLVGPGTGEAIMDLLVPRASIVTPNIDEAAGLAGIPVRNRADMVKAAEVLSKKGARAVLVKGGHLAGDAVDIFYHQGRFEELSGSRVPGEFHGTGCALSASIAARLALGEELRDAVQNARVYLRGLMNSAFWGRGDAGILFPGNT